jgi:hypothetical protein
MKLSSSDAVHQSPQSFEARSSDAVHQSRQSFEARSSDPVHQSRQSFEARASSFELVEVMSRVDEKYCVCVGTCVTFLPVEREREAEAFKEGPVFVEARE